jgi:hypothetical protein
VSAEIRARTRKRADRIGGTGGASDQRGGFIGLTGNEVAAHAFGVGFESGKRRSRFDGLMDGHTAAIERGTSGGAGGTQEFGFQGK